MLTKDEIKKVAELARIELTEEEIERFTSQLGVVIDYVKELSEVNTEGIEEVSQVTGLVNVQRQDIPHKAENHAGIFANAPDMKDGYFKVKAVL